VNAPVVEMWNGLAVGISKCPDEPLKTEAPSRLGSLIVLVTPRKVPLWPWPVRSVSVPAEGCESRQ
jgi:hypothetical protein